jgi:hypothetical protein
MAGAEDRANAGMRPERRPGAGIDGERVNLAPPVQINPGRKAKNPGGLGACVREDLMDLLIERNRLG